MFGKKVVKDYQGNKEDLVLTTVRKYPLYSLDKLAEVLPEMSRHSIQRILEKNNLSIVERRIAFVTEKRLGILEGFRMKMLDLFREIGTIFERLRELIEALKAEPRFRWQLVKSLAILVGVVLILRQGGIFVLAKPPAITLDQPETSFKNEGERLFVKGKVDPARSRVTVNGNILALNGDGSFSGVVNIPTGESILKFEAIYKRRKSELIRLVNRVPTQEELMAQKEDEERKKRGVIDTVANIERTVNDLLAANNANTNPQRGIIRILNNHIKEEAGFSGVGGEVTNVGKKEVGWVMITAKFYNQTSEVVDTKYGFATDFGQVIKPGETAKFETQATNKQFARYSLELSFEEGAGLVGGVATEKELKATPAGEMIKEVK